MHFNLHAIVKNFMYIKISHLPSISFIPLRLARSSFDSIYRLKFEMDIDIYLLKLFHVLYFNDTELYRTIKFYKESLFRN